KLAPTLMSELFVPVPWGEIRGRVWGPRQGYPVLCLHGWADNCGSFNTLIPLLPKEYRYVTIDLAGHGLSSHYPPGALYTCLSYVADVRRVLDCEYIIIIIFLLNIFDDMSALFPEMVDALVLLDAEQFVVTDKETTSKMRQGLDEIIQFEASSKKKKVYTYAEALERLLAAIPITKHSAQILLERGLVSVEGGIDVVRMMCFFVRFFQCECVTVEGDHHVHLNNPEHVAPHISKFLQTKLSSSSSRL
uniref:AB hydrolase-1 domain-containing protein n=1 Tax=Periophthalmus magnuspinnatus TaxID=409849 RepID=A0A3B3ZT40_9GOBI